jgi:hypothetical protein
MKTIRAVICTPNEKAYAYNLIVAAVRMHQAMVSGKARLVFTRRFKAKKILRRSGEERVAERLVYSRCFDNVSSERGGNVIDGLMSAPKDKRLENGIAATAKAQAAAEFKADKPRLDRPDKPNEKPYKPNNNKAKLKDRTGNWPLPSSDKTHKKTETVKEECRGSSPRRLMHTRF